MVLGPSSSGKDCPTPNHVDMTNGQTGRDHDATPMGEQGTPDGTRQAAEGGEGTDAQEQGTTNLPADQWHEFMEDGLLTSFHMAQATAATTTTNRAPVRQELVDWPHLQAFLKHMGYNPFHDDPWAALGVLPIEGPAPTVPLLEKRWERAKLVLSCTKGNGWEAEDLHRADQAATHLERALEACLAALPRVLATRRSARGTPPPQWQELGQTALDMLLATPITDRDALAVQSSDLLGVRPASATNHTVLSTAQTKELYGHIFSADQRQNMFEKIWGGTLAQLGLTIWAPTDQTILGRLMAAYERWHTTTGEGRPIRLLVPFDPLPGCSTAASIQDLFWHPLMGKWSHVVKEVCFAYQPMQMVLQGARGPAHAMKGLLMVTICHARPHTIPKVLSVEEPLLTLARGHTLVVDMPLSEVSAVRRALHHTAGRLGVTMHQTQRSWASSAQNPRATLEAHFPPGALNEVDLLMYVKSLRQEYLAPSVMVGSRQLFYDNSALLAELSDPTALLHLWPHCEEVVLISRRLASIRTGLEPADMTRVLDTIMDGDPEVMVKKIRWRASRQGGRPWATPSVTTRQMAALERSVKGRHLPEAARNTAEVTIPGSLGHNPRQVIDTLMAVVASRTGLALTEGGQNQGARPGTWQRLQDSDPSAAPGRLRLHLQSYREVELLAEQLHGKAIQIGVDLLAVDVFHPDLVHNPGNGQAGRSGRAPPQPRPPAGR